MLRALLEADVHPDLVVGTSIGALNGAFLAGHPDLDGVAALEHLWSSVRRRDVFPINIRMLVSGVTGQRNHLFDLLGLRSLIARADLGFARLDEAPVPVHAVATDLHRGEPVVLSTGDAVEALLASAAIPGVFAPVTVGGRALVDGGVVANVPVAQAIALGATRLFVLPATSGEVPRGGRSALDMVRRSVMIATAATTTSDLQRAAASAEVHVLPVPDGRPASMFDFGATRALIEEAYVRSRAWLDSEPLLLVS
jgi:NTE family protein